MPTLLEAIGSDYRWTGFGFDVSGSVTSRMPFYPVGYSATGGTQFIENGWAYQHPVGESAGAYLYGAH